MSAESAIWAESLSKAYRSGGTQVVVFHELSLQVRPGERLAIIGESGAGKSTLLHLLGGLERPSSGQIFYGGQEIAALGDQALADFRNRTIGFVWQNPSLLPEFTALENVMMPLLIRGVEPGAARKTARLRLEEVGLESRQEHRAGELSGGEQQRAALARALAGGPRVLLADEPTGSLDFRTGEMIVGLLNEVHLAHGLTSIFATHNLSFASRCDRVLELRKGSLHTASMMDFQSPVVVEHKVPVVGGNNEVRTGGSEPVVRGNNEVRTGRLEPVVRVDEAVERTGRLEPVVRGKNEVRTGRFVPVVRGDVERTGRLEPVVRGIKKDATRLDGGTYV
ncbi:MAG: ABC transporter ATP-binding protein [Acidobacteriaceae bacterium]|nr:ABC transporter ATP-binding protein [Acidobacteriaceae bacterium]